MTDSKSLEDFALTPADIIEDYRIAWLSRHASVVGRREVLSGRAKFGIFGDGKEVPQLALAHVFEKGDFRSGYYRDQTWWFALGESNPSEFFAALYAHADVLAEPVAGGRQMQGHYATRLLNPDGSWKAQTDSYNTSADLSPTASQMPRMVGLAQASRIYRDVEALKGLTNFSIDGNEVIWGTIGNASCAEGHFWETVNAIGVLGAPAVISIWDDGYGISVPNKHQVTKENLSEILSGFERDEEKGSGYDIYVVPAWDFLALLETYTRAAKRAREEHVPSIVHVIEVTQPQGHSTSGSHERYKSSERLAFEVEFDCITRMKKWILDEEYATEEALNAIETETRTEIYQIKDAAWAACHSPIEKDAAELAALLDQLGAESRLKGGIKILRDKLMAQRRPTRQANLETIRKALVLTRDETLPTQEALIRWRDVNRPEYQKKFSSHVWSQSAESIHNVKQIPPSFSKDSPKVSGFQVLNATFDAMFARDPRVVAFGEDLGFLGGVNQSMAGLQKKYGELRVSDTGIREATILGQGLGLAVRGLRPIAEIQYLDYLLYCIQLMSDDLATLHWRTAGGQKAPLIIRTRGHRLEGVWHAGSPMASIINLCHGINILVPRDMVRAAGFYNTLLQSDEPGLVIEVLNGYRLKEIMPDNVDKMTIPVGVPETIRQGEDITIVTYGACCRIALESAELLSEMNIDCEVIDVQSLLPFDIHHKIVESVKKTSRVVFLDEDMPGGTTAYMMQKVIEEQGAFEWLDAEPVTISAKPHRPAYGSDGNYFSKPNVEDVFEAVYEIMNEADPDSYPFFYK